MVITRKNNEGYVLELSEDLVDAITWHIRASFAGPEFVFSTTGAFPTYLDSHVRPLRKVQELLGLPELNHPAIGRHSVASQAATGGTSIKVIQAQLGHRSEQSTHQYTHLGSRAQLRLVESLTPETPPHTRGNNVATLKRTGTEESS